MNWQMVSVIVAVGVGLVSLNAWIMKLVISNSILELKATVMEDFVQEKTCKAIRESCPNKVVRDLC